MLDPAAFGGVRPRLLLAAGLATVTGYDAVRVFRLRRDAPRRGGRREHGRTVGNGYGPPLRLAVLGDSAADGFGLADAVDAYPLQVARRVAAAAGRRVAVRSYAVSGARTADLTAAQVPRLAADGADVVAVSVGVNDVLAARSAYRIAADTEALLAAVAAAAPGAAVGMVGAPDLSHARGLPQPLRAVVGWRCRVANRAQMSAARRRGAGFGLYPGAPAAAFFGPDGIHPNAAGQAVAAAVTLAALEPARSW